MGEIGREREGNEKRIWYGSSSSSDVLDRLLSTLTFYENGSTWFIMRSIHGNGTHGNIYCTFQTEPVCSIYVCEHTSRRIWLGFDHIKHTLTHTQWVQNYTSPTATNSRTSKCCKAASIVKHSMGAKLRHDCPSLCECVCVLWWTDWEREIERAKNK